MYCWDADSKYIKVLMISPLIYLKVVYGHVWAFARISEKHGIVHIKHLCKKKLDCCTHTCISI